MKYSVEYKNGQFIEALEVNNNTVTKTWQRKNDGTISGLYSTDLEFSEQLKTFEEEDVLDYVNDLFDNSLLIADIEDFLTNCGVE